MACEIVDFKATPTSLVTRAEPARQRVTLTCQATCDAHLYLSVICGGESLVVDHPLAVSAGENNLNILLPLAEKESCARFVLHDDNEVQLAVYEQSWTPPREWTLYSIRGSHIDIGLHNSQYFQRQYCSTFLEDAMRLCDKTTSWEEAEQYRYTIDGTWFWNNYAADHGAEATRKVVERYVKQGRIAVGAATAGNHTQVYGPEEMCRSAYTREKLKRDWGVDSRTMTMIDNNGMSWAMVAPYAEAGFENIVFAPNQWNPLPSTIWPMDKTVGGATWNPEAGGGGARIDVRYDSALPMVFYWQARDDAHRLLVWGSTQYGWGGTSFGLKSGMGCRKDDLDRVAECTAKRLATLESKCPYNVWLFASYDDDEAPQLGLNEVFREWNRQWRWPQLRAVGNLDEPFDRLRKDFGDDIPVLSGDITGGWYQHPVATPELLAQKFAADRLLPIAEKLATVAAILDPNYRYPATAFEQAWEQLIFNDEHSYGTSGYQGRRVYETWLQHRDWIDKAEKVAQQESERALEVVAAQVSADVPSVILFNPTLQERREVVLLDSAKGGSVNVLSPTVPAFGYAVVPVGEIPSASEPVQGPSAEIPAVENQYYRITFAADGSIASIIDKALNRELFDSAAPFRGNQFVYTQDNHETFVTPGEAVFQVERDVLGVTVIATMEDTVSGASIVQRVTLPDHEKRIDIDNQLNHVKDLINTDRYYRYGYYAFPFAVEDAVPTVNLNGCIAVPGKDQTGHGTETYMAARDWCCVENHSLGVALLQLDSQLVEFGRIHSDKTDCYLKEQGSAIYSYLFNDWLQMHTPGGSHVNPRFRYSIVSYTGNFRAAGVPQMAERLANPLLTRPISAQEGSLPVEGMSFLSVNQPNVELLAFKRAEDGRGVIARFHETHDVSVNQADISQSFWPDGKASRCTIDERTIDGEDMCSISEATLTMGQSGYATLRVEGLDLAEAVATAMEPGDVPADIGSVYTGLVTEPRAVCGEYQGHLYLEWGQNMEEDLSHYELYRSERSGFTPDKATLVGEVEPGPYRVALYEDRNLRTHTEYFYQVRAVNRIGRCSRFSAEFSGLTRE